MDGFKDAINIAACPGGCHRQPPSGVFDTRLEVGCHITRSSHSSSTSSVIRSRRRLWLLANDLSYVRSLNRSSTPSDIEQLKTLDEADRRRKKMARRNLLTILLLSVFAIGAFCATTNNIARGNVPADELSKFQSLLDSIDPTHLHDVLHSHLKEKFKHGVFEEDKKALEAVHQEDREAATSLYFNGASSCGALDVDEQSTSSSISFHVDSCTVAINQHPSSSSKHDDNHATRPSYFFHSFSSVYSQAPTTTTIVNPAPSSSAQSAPVQNPQSSQGSPSSASNSQGPANSPTSRASSPTTSQGPVTSSTFLAPSPTSGETQVSTSVERSSSSLVVSSPASSLMSQQTRESTSAEGPSSSQAGSSTRAGSTSQRPQASSDTVSSRPNSPTDSSSNNQSPTPTPTGGNSNPTETPNEAEPSVTQQVVYKTTLPNGAVTTVTSITVVPAAGEVTGANGATRTSVGNAGLQTGAATRERSGINVALLGALGIAAAAAL
ncbi:hypothetical protein M7I_5526 [Glarea lozoyensis 74030]|uniref:Uncharacterized protein n=1 Tax=Glarea lozoyensis (strain ATCC 74030 / MF5533) TaxID=1104152 RepID=H0ES50_GLAL7|nr:hypothetical protein M7I_5526 [Glarea lozoyensis 74030]